MELPALLPKSLEYIAAISSERGLFEALIQNLEDFILFFEFACDDETWSESHTVFMKMALEWMTERFFQDKFPVAIAKRAAVKFRQHSSILGAMILKNFTILLNGREYELNSLLWGTGSEILRNLIRQQCRDLNSQTLRLQGISELVLDQIEEYLFTGKVQELWRKNQQQIMDVLTQAEEWDLTGLMEICEALLKKYISSDNSIEMLLEAHRKKWHLLEAECVDFINAQDLGVKFEKDSKDYFSMEFLNFREPALKIFELVRKDLTRLICGFDLTDHSSFSDVINRCPHLICLDISATNSFTDRLFDIPRSLQELDVGKCEWLTNANMKKLIEICPHLTKVGLAGNLQLNYSFWGLLKNLPSLQKLDLSQCYQMKDEDFKLVLQACRGVTELYLNECTGLSDNAFFELAKNLAKLTDLDVSRTNISDSGLIDLIVRCKQLMSLKVSRCPNLTDKGILEVIYNAPFIKFLDVAKCRISIETLSKINELRPHLEIMR